MTFRLVTRSRGNRSSSSMDASLASSGTSHESLFPEALESPVRVAIPTFDRNVVIALGVSAAIILWAIINLLNGWLGFAAIVPDGFRGGSEAAISLARLFAALVLILIVTDGMGPRLRWVACGFVVLGLGQLAFGYVKPILIDDTDLNTALYEMILVRSVAGALFVVGLVLREPPRFSVRSAIGVALVCAGCIAVYWVIRLIGSVPELVQIESLEAATRLRIAPTSWMTGWHWALAAIPLALAVAASFGALARSRGGVIGGWLPLSLVLLAGSELHDALWPSTYGNSALLNTADLLRLAMAAVVVIGGAAELRRIADERACLLRAEQERRQRLEELATVKADFTAMVAHELGHPLSAIRRQAELIGRNGIDDSMRQRSVETIIHETDAMDALVADVQATASVERSDFVANLRPIPLGDLIAEVLVSSEAHSRNQPLETKLDGIATNIHVLADPDRIGQVLRNLLSNAAKYSPAHTPVRLYARTLSADLVRIDVSDNGPGIQPREVPRIFEKFGRGRLAETGNGAGLGLYVSRKIIQAHGSDLTVRSVPGNGATFSFTLKLASTTGSRAR